MSLVESDQHLCVISPHIWEYQYYKYVYQYSGKQVTSWQGEQIIFYLKCVYLSRNQYFVQPIWPTPQKYMRIINFFGLKFYKLSQHVFFITIQYKIKLNHI